ncbi:MAG: response regulator [Gammaproteobacteria bacterium]|nr:response regulator [Gammaproteobacteria bacterium]
MSILIVDDHELVREGIARLLNDAQDIEIAGQLSSGEEVLGYLSMTVSNRIQSHGGASFTSSSYQMPDIILLDARMPGLNGIEATRAILKRSPDCKILAMSSVVSGVIPAQMLRSGARGFITKSGSVEELLKAIRTVSAGGNYVTPSLATRLAIDPFGEESGGLFDKLSRRELQISQMLTEGKKVSQISSDLDLSPKTVYSYRYRIFEKLGISSDVELTLLAVKQWPSRLNPASQWTNELLSHS